MKILGVGTDIVNVKRIERIVKKNKNSFLRKKFNAKAENPEPIIIF